MTPAPQPRALVTGASGGIGYELAKLFAQDGTSLILVARQEAALRRIQQEFEQHYGIQVAYRALDLSEPGAAAALHEWCRAQGLAVDYLVNSAGYGDYGLVAQADPARYQNLLQLNVVALTTLTTLFVKDMVAHRRGRILNIGSLAAFQPVPQLAVYAASKSFVMHFTEALHGELRGTGVSATVLNPGVTKTGFVARAGMGRSADAQGALLDAAQVARAGYRGLLRGQLNVVPGLRGKLLSFSAGLLPSRWLLLAIATLVSRPTR